MEEINFDYRNEFNQNILHLLCKEGKKETLLEVLLHLKNINKLRDEINLKDNKSWSPIYYAIDISENGFPDILEVMLRHGADVNISDSFGVTPLHLASYKGQDDNVEILLKHKADPSLKDQAGSNN